MEVSADNDSGCVASYVDGTTSMATIDCLRSHSPKHHRKNGGSLINKGKGRNTKKKQGLHLKLGVKKTYFCRLTQRFCWIVRCLLVFFPKTWVCKIVILEYAKVSASKGSVSTTFRFFPVGG